MLDYRNAEFSDIEWLSIQEEKIFPYMPWNSYIWEITLSSEFDKTMLAYDGESLIGYFSIAQIADELHIMNIAVLEEYRRKGYGRELLKKCLSLADSQTVAAYLEVDVSNDAAISLYKSFGFVEIAKRKHYYGKDMHASIMCKPIC